MFLTIYYIALIVILLAAIPAPVRITRTMAIQVLAGVVLAGAGSFVLPALAEPAGTSGGPFAQENIGGLVVLSRIVTLLGVFVFALGGGPRAILVGDKQL